jgi:hydrogenase nickel incorporation protein HypA/HybF
MHEYALAEAVLRAAVDAAVREGFARLVSVEVRVGELQRIDPEAFAQALEHLRPASEPRLAGTRLDVEVERATFACRACGGAFSLAEAAGGPDEDALEGIHFLPELAHAFLDCPACHSPDFEVRGGRGVEISRIEGAP